jgi:2-keto-4-pentenoate hydratase/2-oxohepta-3-ene-1,7-dioic acid hydratase in catechol pathway
MRVVVFDGHKVGLLNKDGQVVDVSDLVGASADEWPPVAVPRLIAGFGRLRPRLEEALRSRPATPLARVCLGAPVPFPSKVIAAPANYRLHIQEMSAAKMRDVVKQEVHAIDQYGVFLKAPSSVVGPGATVELPFPDRRTDHEVELGFVIGRTARDVSLADAMSYVFGYTGVMDITVRGGEDRSTRKSFDSFTPLGPALVTADEVPDPHDLQLKLWVNGTLRQDGNTRDMIWNIPKLVEYASHVMTLHPGDVVSTGTPDGVGPLAPGDEVTIEIERIGRMSVSVELRKR